MRNTVFIDWKSRFLGVLNAGIKNNSANVYTMNSLIYTLIKTFMIHNDIIENV